MKKILITGSNGLLGQKITDLLITLGDEFEFLATSKGANRHLDAGKFPYQEMDITDKEDVQKVFASYQPEYVIHTAAMTNVDACEDHRTTCDILNVKAVEYLLEASKKCQAHFTFLSTDFVFDGKDGPYKEEDATNPLSYYGKSKLIGEEMVKNSGLQYAILRTIIVYGIANKMSRSNIVLWAKEALSSGKPLKIVNDQYRSPTLAEDLANACITVVRKNSEGLYHISGKDFMSIYELVLRVAKFYGLAHDQVQSVSSKELGQPANRPPKTGFIIDKAICDLGYHPKSFEEGLEWMEKQN